MEEEFATKSQLISNCSILDPLIIKEEIAMNMTSIDRCDLAKHLYFYRYHSIN